MKKNKIELGDLAKDVVSGFKGVVNAELKFLNGCKRFCLQPPITKDGKHPEALYFDEPQLVVIKKQKVPYKNPENLPEQERHETGGPVIRSSSLTDSRATPRR